MSVHQKCMKNHPSQIQEYIMSDLPRIEPDNTEMKKLRLAAMILSNVVGLFVAYWIVYGMHMLFEVFAKPVAHTAWSWVVAGTVGVAAGALAVFRVYVELTSYVDM